jgi:transcriptional regulator with XRE-family HTH domain
MAKPSPIGEQVTRLRVLRGWSQEELAHRAGVAVDTVRKLESGTRGMVRLHTLNRISAALDVELSVALVAPPLLPPVAAGGLLAIRKALTSADLVGLAEYAEAGPVPDVGALAASVDVAWTVWQDGQYDVLAATLPDLIAEARHAVREMTGDDQIAACGLLATCCQIAAGVTMMVGAEDLAWTAVERSLTAAEQSGDQLSCASAAQFASWIYRRQGRYDECQQVATRAAERYEPRMSTAEPAQLSIWGGLLVEASGAAARANRPADADDGTVGRCSVPGWWPRPTLSTPVKWVTTRPRATSPIRSPQEDCCPPGKVAISSAWRRLRPNATATPRPWPH